MSKVKSGGFDRFSLKGSVLVEGYIPCAGRQNLLMDPDKSLGKFTPNISDQYFNGPGTLVQALPTSASKSYDRIFAVPSGNPFKSFSVDDRQITGYQVEQLKNNPLSQYRSSDSGVVPKFNCFSEPDNFSNMVSKRNGELDEIFEEGTYGNKDWLQGTTGGQNIYKIHSGPEVNANSDIVYNLSLNSTEQNNPMISLGSSNRARTKAQFTGKCYSGDFVPGRTITDSGGNNPPKVYGGNKYVQRNQSDVGMGNSNTKEICIPDKSLSFVNPLIIQ